MCSTADRWFRLTAVAVIFTASPVRASCLEGYQFKGAVHIVSCKPVDEAHPPFFEPLQGYEKLEKIPPYVRTEYSGVILKFKFTGKAKKLSGQPFYSFRYEKDKPCSEYRPGSRYEIEAEEKCCDDTSAAPCLLGLRNLVDSLLKIPDNKKVAETFAAWKSVQLPVHSSPDGADIYVNGNKVGKPTPTKIILNPNRGNEIVLKKTGYDDFRVNIGVREAVGEIDAELIRRNASAGAAD